MTTKITSRQQEVLNFIAAYVAEYGSSPTRIEIAKHFSFTPTAAQCHLQWLAKKGAISIRPGIARGIKILAAA